MDKRLSFAMRLKNFFLKDKENIELSSKTKQECCVMLFWCNMNLAFAFQGEHIPQLCVLQPGPRKYSVPAWWMGLADHIDKASVRFHQSAFCTFARVPDGLSYTRMVSYILLCGGVDCVETTRCCCCF